MSNKISLGEMVQTQDTVRMNVKQCSQVSNSSWDSDQVSVWRKSFRWKTTTSASNHTWINSLLSFCRAWLPVPKQVSCFTKGGGRGVIRQMQDRMSEAFQQVSFEGEDRQVCTRLSMLKQAVRWVLLSHKQNDKVILTHNTFNQLHDHWNSYFFLVSAKWLLIPKTFIISCALPLWKWIVLLPLLCQLLVCHF